MNMENWGVSIQDFVIEQNQMWFCSSFLNGLFRKDLENEEVFIEYYFNKYPIIGRTLFSKILIRNRKIILIPTVAEEIYIYDIDAKEMMSYTLPECVNIVKNKQGFLFGDAFIYKNNLFLLPDYAEQIVILDIDTGKIDTSNLLTDVIGNNLKQKPLHYIEHESVFVESRIYNFYLNYLLEYDFETQKLSMYEIIDEGYSIKSICKYKDGICVVDSNHNVYVWNGNTCIQKTETLYKVNQVMQSGDSIVMVDMLTGTIIVGKSNQEKITIKNCQLNQENISNVKVIDGELYLTSITNNTVIALDLDNKNMSKRKVLINSEKIRNLSKENKFEIADSIIYEQGAMELSILLSNCMSFENDMCEEEKCGKTIYLKGNV